MDPDEILLDTEDRMDKAVNLFGSQLQGLRTGRASPGLVDSIRVEYYGSQTPIKQLASISCPEPQSIVIKPFDAGALSAIVKAIQGSDLGLAPNSDGRLVRLNIPPLSTETRRKLVSRVKDLAEEARISIRNVRRDGNKHIDTLHKDKLCTEDERDTLKEKMQEMTKNSETKINEQAATKEKEVMEQ